MKWTSANKLLGLLLLQSLMQASCTYMPEQKLLSGTWVYQSVLRGDSSIMELSSDDRFTLDADSSFAYSIASVNKDMSGTWSFSGDTLHLHYDKPDTIRHFAIDIISEHTLSMHEGPVHFKLSRLH